MNTQVLCLLMITLISLGCRRENSQPELTDPIYTDLVIELKAMESLKDSTLSAIEKANSELSKSKPRSLERKMAKDEIQKQQDKLTRMIEMIEYYKIRVERRRVEGRRAYKIAFAKGKTWPDPEEHKAYLINKKLIHASRSWSDRVPKFSTSTEAAIGSKSGGSKEKSEAPSSH